MHRAGAAGGGGAEGGGHELRDPLAVVNHPRALGDRRRHSHLVDLLERRHPLFGKLGASGDEHNGTLGGVDGRKGGNSVGEAGASGEHAHRRPAGDSSVAVGHVQRRSLVAGVNELDSLILGRIDQWKNGVAHDGEYFFDAFQLQTAYEQMCPGQFRHGPLLIFRRGLRMAASNAAGGAAWLSKPKGACSPSASAGQAVFAI